MEDRINLSKTVRQLVGLLDYREKYQTLVMLLLMAFGAGLEAIGISAIVPFIHLVSNPGIVETEPRLQAIYQFLSLSSPRAFLFLAGAAIFGLYLLKNAYFVFFYSVQNRFLATKKVSLATGLLGVYMKAPYTFHLQNNTAELLRNVSSISKAIEGVWAPLLVMITELLIVAVLLALLFVSQPVATIAAGVVLGLPTLIFYRVVRPKISSWTKQSFEHGAQVTKWLYQGIGGIKEISILGRERFFIDAFKHHYEVSANLIRRGNTVNQLPRLFIETIVVAGIVAFVLVLLWSGNTTTNMLSSLALFAVVAARLMPSMNRLVLSAMMLREGSTVVNLVHESMRQVEGAQLKIANGADTRASEGTIAFNERLELGEVSFQYPGASAPSVENIALSIRKNESVAFVGPSGAGKTTIVDIILGLLPPTRGAVLVDGRDIRQCVGAWQSKIGYIPQAIYLSDDSIRRNIAFGMPDSQIADEKIWAALSTAQLDEFVRSLPKGLDTVVGERGVRLSGGQRQRIGIARALYHNPEVLVLDEATSALDTETEREIGKAIDALHGSKTLIIIAHRMSTVSRCDKLFFIREGRLVDSGSFAELKNKNADFSKLATT